MNVFTGKTEGLKEALLIGPPPSPEAAPLVHTSLRVLQNTRNTRQLTRFLLVASTAQYLQLY